MPSCFSESNFYGPKSENKVDFYSGKKVRPRNIPPHMRNASLTTLLKKWTKIQKSSTQFLKKLIKTTKFLKKNISWENVSSHIDSMFGSPYEKKRPQKSEKLWLEKKVGVKYFIEAFSSSKGSPGHVESKNDTHAKNLCQRLPKFISNFTYSCKSSAGGIDCILTERQNKFHGTLKSFPLKFQKNQVIIFLLKHFFLRKVLWTREMQFSKPCKNFCQKSDIPSTNSETKRKIFSPKFTISWKNSSGGITYILDSPLQKLFTKNRKTLHSKSEKTY